MSTLPHQAANALRVALPALATLALVALVLAACSAATEAPASFDANAPTLSAASSKFDKTELDVPGGAGFELVLHNNDSVQHNVSIYKDEGHSQRVFGGDLASNGTHIYHVQALAPGTYYFQCDIHPDMKGIVVAASG
jgi:plastocyanin